MRVLCIARHPFLSEHLGRLFAALGVETAASVGLGYADDLPLPKGIDAVVCEYDLLAPLASDAWKAHPLLSSYPVIAVSLTRRSGDAQLKGSVEGFFYLPALEADAARAMLAAVVRRNASRSSDVLPRLGNSPVAPLR